MNCLMPRFLNVTLHIGNTGEPGLGTRLIFYDITTRTAKLVRWLQEHVMIPSSLTFAVHPSAVQSRRVKFQDTQISLPSALNYNVKHETCIEQV